MGVVASRPALLQLRQLLRLVAHEQRLAHQLVQVGAALLQVEVVVVEDL